MPMQRAGARLQMTQGAPPGRNPAAAGRIALVGALVLALTGFTTGRAAAQIDLNGLWRMEFFVVSSSVNFADACAIMIAQTGDMVQISGSCPGVANPVMITGTIDTATGAVSASGMLGACGTVTMTASVPAGSRFFTGAFDCQDLSVTGLINADRCGNGQIDAGEECDDGNRIDGDCCAARCQVIAAGGACADDGSACTSDVCNANGECEHNPITGTCNDGNSCTTGDTCSNGQCVGTLRPDAAACDDGNACTTGDTCAGGVCVAQPVVCDACLECVSTFGCVPAIGNACKQSPAHALVMRRVAMDTVTWRFDRGDATETAEFGDPTATTGYDFCIYDGSADETGAPGLVLSARAAAGDGWHALREGFVYNGQDLTDGPRRVLLRSGSTGRSRLRVKARAPQVMLPPLQSLARPLTVQLKSTDGSQRCWSAQYDRPALHNPLVFRGALKAPLPDTRPNILLVQLDDTRADGIDRMPTLLSEIAGQGISFTNSFVTNPVCAPSRASIFTGLNSTANGVRALGGEIGGHGQFRASGADRQTVGVWLQAAGYTTGFFGKYINGYGFIAADIRGGPGGTYYVPPGWTRWRVMTSPEHFGGIYGTPYTLIDEHGIATRYDDQSNDAQYSTDVLAQQVREFMSDAVNQQRRFFAVWTPYASHADLPSFIPEPAARHYGWFRSLAPWRPPNYAEADVSDKPPWIANVGVGFIPIIITDLIRSGAYETLLSVDEQLGLIMDHLAALGIADNTVIIVTSDNGVGWGEHRVFNQAKQCVYEECLRVPMIVRDPRVGNVPAVREAAVTNIDVAPTIAALAGVEPPVPMDGVSFASALAGEPAAWREDFLIEGWRSNRGFTVDYAGQVTDGDQIRFIYGDSRHQPRPSALFEFDSGDGVSAGAVPVLIGIDPDATFAALITAVETLLPIIDGVPIPNRDRVNFVDLTPENYGFYVRVERNQADAMLVATSQGDWFGVRDAAGGFTYAEHESGPVELYDLNVDPYQLENKADDPAYAETRARLAARLDELLE